MTAATFQQSDDAIFDEGGICLRGERAKRSHRALSAICRAAESLDSSSALFPNISGNADDIDPRYAVKAFVAYTSRHFSLLLSAAAGEDLMDYPLPSSNSDTGP